MRAFLAHAGDDDDDDAIHSEGDAAEALFQDEVDPLYDNDPWSLSKREVVVEDSKWGRLIAKVLRHRKHIAAFDATVEDKLDVLITMMGRQLQAVRDDVNDIVGD